MAAMTLKLVCLLFRSCSESCRLLPHEYSCSAKNNLSGEGLYKLFCRFMQIALHCQFMFSFFALSVFHAGNVLKLSCKYGSKKS